MATISNVAASFSQSRVYARFMFNDSGRTHRMANGLFMPGNNHEDYRRRIQQLRQQRPALARAAVKLFGEGTGPDGGLSSGASPGGTLMQQTMAQLQQQAANAVQGVQDQAAGLVNQAQQMTQNAIKTLSDGSPDNRQFDDAVQKLAEETAQEQFEQRVEEEVAAQIEAQELVSMDELYRMARLIAANAVQRIISQDPELNGGRGMRSRRRFY